MKIDRLLALTIYLLNHGKTSAQVLANEFEVSTRTIMRDMSSLEMAGIPIQAITGVDGGFQIMDSYIMDKQLAKQGDYDFIVTALQGLTSAYHNKNMEQTLKKMENLTGNKPNTIQLDFGVAKEKTWINNHIALLEEAIKREKMVTFQYTNNACEIKQMLVEPVSITYKWYNWYLIAYYEKHDDYCMFKLARIEHLQISSQNNTKKHDLEQVEIQSNDTREVVKVRFYGKANVKVRCKEYLNGTIEKEYENGDFEYCLFVPIEESYWYGVILSMGNNIKILEPQSVIDKIKSTCKDLQEEYGGLE